jgi:hypothetical protein
MENFSLFRRLVKYGIICKNLIVLKQNFMMDAAFLGDSIDFSGPEILNDEIYAILKLLLAQFVSFGSDEPKLGVKMVI